MESKHLEPKYELRKITHAKAYRMVSKAGWLWIQEGLSGLTYWNEVSGELLFVPVEGRYCKYSKLKGG